MESVMRKVSFVLLAVSGALIATAAGAQDWRPYDRDGGYEYGSRYGNADDVCSGRRAHMLERWVDRDVRNGSMDPERGDRFHANIDRLENWSRRECAEGDGRSIDRISQRYSGIEGALRAVEWDR